jgi:hypothetical protein
MYLPKKWTEELVESELRALCGQLGYFPSNSELRQLKRGDLSNQICKKGGFVHWSKRVGCERKHSDSDTGWEGEDAVAKLLTEKGFHVEPRKTIRCPYDLLVGGVIRVDVKTAKYAEYGGKNYSTGWFYRIGKDVQSDIVILYQSDTSICYIIPWKYCNSSNITITKTGDTYAKFRENFKLLENLVRSRSTEMEIIP